MATTTDSYRADTIFLTILRTDKNGEDHDLNAGGESCKTLGALRGFVRELHAQGAYDDATRDELLESIDSSLPAAISLSDYSKGIVDDREEALEHADAAGLIICKYTDPTEGARSGLTVAEALEVVREDPSLIYLVRESG